MVAPYTSETCCSVFLYSGASILGSRVHLGGGPVYSAPRWSSWEFCNLSPSEEQSPEQIPAGDSTSRSVFYPGYTFMEIRRSSEQSKPGFRQALLLNEVSRLDEALTPWTTQGFFIRLGHWCGTRSACGPNIHTRKVQVGRGKQGSSRQRISLLPVCVCLRVVCVGASRQ